MWKNVFGGLGCTISLFSLICFFFIWRKVSTSLAAHSWLPFLLSQINLFAKSKVFEIKAFFLSLSPFFHTLSLTFCPAPFKFIPQCVSEFRNRLSFYLICAFISFLQRSLSLNLSFFYRRLFWVLSYAPFENNRIFLTHNRWWKSSLFAIGRLRPFSILFVNYRSRSA